MGHGSHPFSCIEQPHPTQSYFLQNGLPVSGLCVPECANPLAHRMSLTRPPTILLQGALSEGAEVTPSAQHPYLVPAHPPINPPCEISAAGGEGGLVRSRKCLLKRSHIALHLYVQLWCQGSFCIFKAASILIRLS